VAPGTGGQATVARATGRSILGAHAAAIQRESGLPAGLLTLSAAATLPRPSLRGRGDPRRQDVRAAPARRRIQPSRWQPMNVGRAGTRAIVARGTCATPFLRDRAESAAISPSRRGATASQGSAGASPSRRPPDA